MNISTTKCRTNRSIPDRQPREQSEAILKRRNTRVFFGGQQFSRVSEAIDEVGKSIHLPEEGLPIDVSFINPTTPKVRALHHLENFGSSGKQEMNWAGGLGVVAGVAGLGYGIINGLQALPMAVGAVSLIGGAALLKASHSAHEADKARASRLEEREEYSLAEKGLEGRVLPSGSSDNRVDLNWSNTRAVSFYRAKPTDQNQDVFEFSLINERTYLEDALPQSAESGDFRVPIHHISPEVTPYQTGPLRRVP